MEAISRPLKSAEKGNIIDVNFYKSLLLLLSPHPPWGTTLRSRKCWPMRRVHCRPRRDSSEAWRSVSTRGLPALPIRFS